MENLTELEHQTLGNCIYNGFGNEVMTQVIELMRKKNVEYLSSQKIQQIHSFKKLSDGKILFPYNFILETTDTFNPKEAREIVNESTTTAAKRFYKIAKK